MTRSRARAVAADFFPVNTPAPAQPPAPVTQPPPHNPLAPAQTPPPPPSPPPLPRPRNGNQNEHESLPCNCPAWKQRQGLCPLGGQCRQANVIYGASIKTIDVLGDPVDESEETYTGTSYTAWKTRLYSHNTTFNNPALRHKTTLADYIWDLQCPDKCYERGDEQCGQSIDYEITWKIL